jgi:hypothetical protein
MERWWCMDCTRVVSLDRHGRCGVCSGDAVTDTQGRSVMDTAELAKAEEHLKWLAWAEAVVDNAARERK